MIKYILIASIVLASCSSAQKANRKLRKAKALIAQAKELGAYVERDTVFTDRVVIIPGDSVVLEKKFTELRDTVIYKDRVKLTIKRDTVRLRIEAECIPDTVKIRVPVIVNETITCPPVSSFWKTLALSAISLLLLVLTLWKVLK